MGGSPATRVIWERSASRTSARGDPLLALGVLLAPLRETVFVGATLATSLRLGGSETRRLSADRVTNPGTRRVACMNQPGSVPRAVTSPSRRRDTQRLPFRPLSFRPFPALAFFPLAFLALEAFLALRPFSAFAFCSG